MGDDHQDIGHGVTIRFVNAPDDTESGLIEEHPSDGKTESGRCSGVVLWKHDDPNRPTWTLESRDPLTLSPSIQCRTCGHHGYIREGRWIPA